MSGLLFLAIRWNSFFNNFQGRLKRRSSGNHNPCWRSFRFSGILVLFFFSIFVIRLNFALELERRALFSSTAIKWALKADEAGKKPPKSNRTRTSEMGKDDTR